MGRTMVRAFEAHVGRWHPRARCHRAWCWCSPSEVGLDVAPLIGVWSAYEDHPALRACASHCRLSPAVSWSRESAADKLQMNDSPHDLWEVARTVYSIGLLALGIVLVGLTIVFLRVLPGALRVGRQLAKAITRHAKVLERDADASDAVRRVEDVVTELHQDVKLIKSNIGDGKSHP